MSDIEQIRAAEQAWREANRAELERDGQRRTVRFVRESR